LENKEIMDGTCFQLIYATIQFNPAYRIVDQEVKGGELIDWEQYQALTKPATSL
jgi:(2Fe-2S) ferredoxin